MGFFPESYVEVGSTSEVSAPSNSYTDGPLHGSTVSIASVGPISLGSTKYCKFYPPKGEGQRGGDGGTPI